MERLRYLARSSGGDQRVLVAEAAHALRALHADPAGLVPVCRRLVARHPDAGALWSLAAGVLMADPADAGAVAVDLATRVDSDPTPSWVESELADGATVCLVGWPELAGEGVLRRGDLEVLVVDVGDQGHRLVHELRRLDACADIVPGRGVAAAVRAADLVVLDSTAVGDSAALVAPGGHAAAAVAWSIDVPVWLTVGVARRLPGTLFDIACARVSDEGLLWDAPAEQLPLSLVSAFLGPEGRSPQVRGADGPVAAELLRVGL